MVVGQRKTKNQKVIFFMHLNKILTVICVILALAGCQTMGPDKTVSSDVPTAQTVASAAPPPVVKKAEEPAVPASPME